MAITTFAPIGAWLGSTPLSQGARAALRAIDWLAPADETLHILALTTLFVSAAIVSLRILGAAGRDHELGLLARRLLPLTWSALGVLIVTGGLLVLNRPGRYFRSDMFIFKMGFVLLAVSVTLALQIALNRDEAFGRGGAARSGAVLTLVLWSGAIVCGRWIAYA